jgi:hypothetical protein
MRIPVVFSAVVTLTTVHTVVLREYGIIEDTVDILKMMSKGRGINKEGLTINEQCTVGITNFSSTEQNQR